MTWALFFGICLFGLSMFAQEPIHEKRPRQAAKQAKGKKSKKAAVKKNLTVAKPKKPKKIRSTKTAKPRIYSPEEIWAADEWRRGRDRITV